MMWDVQGFQNEWFRNSAAWKSGKSFFSGEVRKSAIWDERGGGFYFLIQIHGSLLHQISSSSSRKKKNIVEGKQKDGQNSNVPLKRIYNIYINLLYLPDI